MAGGVEKISSAMHGGSIDSPGTIALWAAVISIVIKEILFQWTARTGQRNNSPAVVTNAWHHRTDALSSVASAIGIGCAIIFGGRWAILDPIVGCGISIFIFYIAVKMAIPALAELTEASLPDDVEAEIHDIIQSVEGVQDVHALKTRRTGPDIIIESHIVVNPDMRLADAHQITVEAENRLRSRFGEETQIAIHVEPDVEAS